MNSSLVIPSQDNQPQPTEDQDALLSWLRFLSRLCPISKCLVIGAGNGTDPLVRLLQELSVGAVTLVEADKACFQHLQRKTADQKTWTISHQLIAPERGQTNFHKTSVPCENGLLEPDTLQNLWPRISARECIEMQAVTLADTMEGSQSQADWLFIDCLPSLPLIESAGDNLLHVNVIVARATTGISPAGATTDQLVAAMDDHGFQFITFQPNRNTRTGHTLFVRNRKTADQKTIARLETEIRTLQEKLSESETARTAIENKTIDDLKAEISSLRDKLTESESARTELEKKAVGIEHLSASFETTISELGSLLSASSMKQKSDSRKLEEVSLLSSIMLGSSSKK